MSVAVLPGQSGTGSALSLSADCTSIILSNRIIQRHQAEFILVAAADCERSLRDRHQLTFFEQFCCRNQQLPPSFNLNQVLTRRTTQNVTGKQQISDLNPDDSSQQTTRRIHSPCLTQLQGRHDHGALATRHRGPQRRTNVQQRST